MGHQGSLIAKIALWLIAVIGTVFCIMIYTGSETGIDGGLWISYIAFFLVLAAVIIFAIVQIFSAGKKAMPTLIGIGAFAVFVAICYALADGTVRPDWNISEGASKWISAGITMTAIAAVGAVLAILYGEVTRFMK